MRIILTQGGGRAQGSEGTPARVWLLISTLNHKILSFIFLYHSYF